MTDKPPTTEPGHGVIVGVDTHRDVNVAAVLDPLGRQLGVESFPTNTRGYQELTEWASLHGPVETVGIEGTGSWGAGLARHVTARGIRCVEVDRPNRQHRRRHGKSDSADAVAAARAVLAGTATGQSRGHNGPVESLRAVRVAYRSANKARTQAINQIRALLTTAPDPLRTRFTGSPLRDIIETCSRFRPQSPVCPTEGAKLALRTLAKRVQHLDDELAELGQTRCQLVTACAPPELLAEKGIGPKVAADLLIAFGDNPDRIRSEASFAALCGVSPVDASSGRQQRHRLNRGGDRQANSAIWRIVLVRLRTDEETRDYIARALNNRKTKPEAIRALKRYVARRIWKILNQHPPQLDQ